MTGETGESMTEAEILDKLSRIEGASQAILTKTAEEKTELQKKADERTRAFDAQTDKEAEAKLQNIQSGLKAQLEAGLERLDSDTEAKMTAFSQHYEEELDERADEIVSRILQVTS